MYVLNVVLGRTAERTKKKGQEEKEGDNLGEMAEPSLRGRIRQPCEIILPTFCFNVFVLA